MKIGLGAKVASHGGEAIGTVDRLIIAPEKRTLVGLIVHRGRFLTEDRLIARDLIEDVGVNGVVRLSLTAHEADALPQFVRAAFVTPAEGMDFVLPSEVLVIEHNAEVVDANGNGVGHIEEVEQDDDGTLTGLRVRGGRFGRKHGYVPAQAIAGAAPKRVRLSIPAAAIAQVDPTEEASRPQVIALAFDEVGEADGMMENFHNWEQRGLIALDDAIVVTVTPSGSAELHQVRHQVDKAAGKGAGVGFLAGLLVGGPIGGFVAGAAIGAIAGKLKDSGLDDNFVRGISGSLRPETSALFLQVRAADVPRLKEELRPYRARVLYATLPPERERALREALAREE